MSDHKDLAPAGGSAEEPIPNPGMHEHQPRPTDVDEKAEKRAERQIATFFGLSTLFAVLFVVAYFAFSIGEEPDLILGFGASTVTLGLTLGLALLLLGIGAIQWARKIMSDVEIVEARHPVASSDEDREATVSALSQGLADASIARRPLIRNSLLGAIGALGLPAIVVLRDLGPLPGDVLEHTVWEKGMRVVNDVSGTPDQAGRDGDRPAGQRRARRSSSRPTRRASTSSRASSSSRRRPRPPSSW